MDELNVRAADPMERCDEYPDSDFIPAPCQQGCPLGTDIPSYVGLIAEEKLEAAFEVISESNPFPATCGRVCAKPCETQCRRGESDGPVSIRSLKRFVTEQVGRQHRENPFPVTRKKTVGIVGGGPTGLTAARDLAEAGYEVHLYEKSGRLGGMMAAGIPPFRLPERFVEADIERILEDCPGIMVRLNCALGDGVSLDELKEKHDAVLLAPGLWRDRKLGVPGEKEGIEGLLGIGFLTGLNQGESIRLEGEVVVVGGGNVAMDAARAALRAGAATVELFCLEALDQMPAWKHEIEEALQEGVRINPSWGPKEIFSENGKLTGIEFVRCTSVFDAQGRFNPEYDHKSVLRKDARAVLVCIGLELENEELQRAGLLERGRVKADFESMRTADPLVFAAGDSAFGPSAIVYAIHHGHRAAHYIEAHLEGVKNPQPYRVRYSSRQVSIIQDPRWETLAREEPRRTLSADAPLSDECELTYERDVAVRQAIRCLRCDAETGTADYSRRTREHIQSMARTDPADVERQRSILQARLKPRKNPFPTGRPANLDDIVFLPAALTRLVIDPYREACSTSTPVGRSLTLRQPFLFTGFDDAPAPVREALALALESSGCAYLGFRPLGKAARAPWLQLLGAPDEVPSPEASGLVFMMGERFEPISPSRLTPDRLLGLCSTGPLLAEVIPYALEKGFDLLVLDGTKGMGRAGSELESEPDFSIMHEAITILRELNREEDIDLAYFGGLRSGTDVAKVLARNCRAAVFGAAVSIAMGGVIAGRAVEFPEGGAVEVDERRLWAENWIKATAQETAIIARCTGKTNVHNLEPEDMRSITLTGAEAMGISLASGCAPREYF
ncbi:MAG: FAD-dependent oxidoreductase [Syntrophobacteraceae bacterium]|nr:FAD-dependent oxidoreductase [Syntrophobacteraceae bacterium]